MNTALETCSVFLVRDASISMEWKKLRCIVLPNLRTAGILFTVKSMYAVEQTNSVQY